MPAYDTVRQLQEGYASGAISADEPLVLDNDSAGAYAEQDGHFTKVFEMHPSDLLRQALDLLGIPHEEA